MSLGFLVTSSLCHVPKYPWLCIKPFAGGVSGLLRVGKRSTLCSQVAGYLVHTVPIGMQHDADLLWGLQKNKIEYVLP